jgi:hypothetical protein
MCTDIPALAMTASKRGASSDSRQLGEATFECAGVVVYSSALDVTDRSRLCAPVAYYTETQHSVKGFIFMD